MSKPDGGGDSESQSPETEVERLERESHGNMRTSPVNIKITDRLNRAVDAAMEEQGYVTFSEFARAAMREKCLDGEASAEMLREAHDGA